MKEYYLIPNEITAKFQRMERKGSSLYFRESKENGFVINVGCGEDMFPEIEWDKFKKVKLSLKSFTEEGIKSI